MSLKCSKTHLQASVIPKFSRGWYPLAPVKKGKSRRGKDRKGTEMGRLRHGCRGMDAPDRQHLLQHWTASLRQHFMSVIKIPNFRHRICYDDNLKCTCCIFNEVDADAVVERSGDTWHKHSQSQPLTGGWRRGRGRDPVARLANQSVATEWRHHDVTASARHVDETCRGCWQWLVVRPHNLYSTAINSQFSIISRPISTILHDQF